MPAIISGSTGGIGLIGSGTLQNSTSGTAIDFTGIPSGVKRITLMMREISTNGTTTSFMAQIGAGSIQTTGYSSQWWTGSAYSGYISTGFVIAGSNAPYNYTGMMVITSMGSNLWTAWGACNLTTVSNIGYTMTGQTSLSGTLDRLRLTTINGTDIFDAGSVNILYE